MEINPEKKRVFTIEAITKSKFEHRFGDKTSRILETKVRIIPMGALDVSQYVEKGVPNENGLNTATRLFLLGIFACFGTLVQKYGVDKAALIDYLKAKLDEMSAGNFVTGDGDYDESP